MTSSPTAAFARFLLIAAFGGLAVMAIGPFQALEFAIVPWDKAAHFLAFYLLTALLFLGFPRRRRVDLAFMATLAGAALEIFQLAAGRDAELGDMVANAAGAFAVVLPGYLETARADMRDRGRKRLDRRRRAFAPAQDAAHTPQVDLI